MVKNFVSMILGLFVCSHCWGRVEIEDTVPVVMPQKIPTSDFASNLNDLGKSLSSDTKNSDDGNVVAQRIGDKALQNWLSSPDVASSPIVHSANKVQDSMKADVHLNDSSEVGPNHIDHRMTFQILALQSCAKVEYKGWVNAAVNYNARDRASVVEVSQKIWDNKDLTLSHTAALDQDISAIGIRWGF